MRKVLLLCALVCLFPGFFALRSRAAEDVWPPASAYVSGVIGHRQQRNLTCESRSASDFAAFFGVTASEADIFAALPRSDNPNYGFVGNPDGTWGQIPPNSYGVHANPIEDALGGFGLPVYGERNLMWDFVRSEIAAGRPVIVWIIGAMWNGTPIEYVDSKGRKAIVAHHEHTMILVGYDSNNVWAVDAYDGVERVYPLSSFLNSWSVLQNMAVYYRIDYTEHMYLPLMVGSDVGQPATLPASDEPAAPTYIVQPGDSLRSIAERYELTWEQLAEINGLVAPFIIYPGQELRLTP